MIHTARAALCIRDLEGSRDAEDGKLLEAGVGTVR
jgi:hypothetical protein